MRTTNLRPVTERERAERAAVNDGEPTLEFGGRVPYDAYVRASTLHSLQRTVSDDPGERSFLVISQVMELYFGMVQFELREAQRLLREDRDDAVWDALAPLRRAALDLEGLNASWRALRWMTPADFNRFRDLLGEGSGFQSAMYRRMEFALGLKMASLIRPFRQQPSVYGELAAELRAPSLWDEVIALLARRGYPIPDAAVDCEVGARDFTSDHEPDPAVEAAWAEIYRDTGPDNHLRLLGEALGEVAETFGDWRYQHLKAVQRAMGAKVGSGGTDGLGWLRRAMDRVVFPELWSARTLM